MNHTWTCSQQPCWGIMRPNEVKNMNTARLHQHLFLTGSPPHPSSSSYSSKVRRTAASGVSMHVLLHRVMAGSGGATDSAATVVTRMDDCAWKQRRCRLIRLSSASGRLLAGVKGQLMRKHKASGGLLSVFVCVGSVEVRESESPQPHRPTHTHSLIHTHTDKDTQIVL